MGQRGWVRSHRVGRRSAYALTDRGLSLLEEGSSRLFGPRPDLWDGCWHIVTYSLPKDLRQERDQLRTRLSWLGYGMLLPGTMVSAFPMREQVLKLIEDLNIESHVHFFTAGHLESADHADIVNRCWDLKAINLRYTQFIQRHQPDYLKLLSQEEGIAPEHSFVKRFWLTYEFALIPREDPGLPAELLPYEWQGTKAFSLLNNYRALVRQPAEEYVQQTLITHPILEPLEQELSL
jgi:phenylacetic acid degradation operon negative regulatory protein